MKTVSTSLVISIALWFSMQGVLPATYIILGILGLVCFLTVYTSVVTIGMIRHIVYNPDQYIEALQERAAKDDPKLRILLHLIYFVATYHIFLLGYSVMAGAVAASVSIVLFSTIVEAMFNKQEQE
jgi:hypothetical protein